MANETMANDTMANDTTADETTANDTMAKRFKYRANLKPNCFFEAFRKNPARFFKPFPDKWDRLGIKWRWPNAKLTFMPIFAMARKRVEGEPSTMIINIMQISDSPTSWDRISITHYKTPIYTPRQSITASRLTK